MTHTYKTLEELALALKSGFRGLELIGVYDVRNNGKNWLHTSGNWEIAKIDSFLSKRGFGLVGFKQLKIDYTNGGFLLIYEIQSEIWLLLCTSEKIYAQINLFLRQMQVETVKWESVVASQPANKPVQKVEDPFIEKLNAAKRLQQAILPKRDSIDKLFAKSVIFYQPQDVIGGDIYWVKEIDDEAYLVVADCTGHSVEGALASMTVHSILSDIIKKGMSPKEIGTTFHERLGSYNVEGEAYGIGVELGVVKFEKAKRMLSYMTTGIPIMIQQKGKLDLIKLKSRFGNDSSPMASALSEENIALGKSDKIAMFSDGLVDLFDSKNAKKLGMKGVKDITEKLMINGSFTDQHFEGMVKQWQGGTEQIDDITYVAIEF